MHGRQGPRPRVPRLLRRVGRGPPGCAAERVTSASAPAAPFSAERTSQQPPRAPRVALRIRLAAPDIFSEAICHPVCMPLSCSIPCRRSLRAPAAAVQRWRMMTHPPLPRPVPLQPLRPRAGWPPRTPALGHLRAWTRLRPHRSRPPPPSSRKASVAGPPVHVRTEQVPAAWPSAGPRQKSDGS